MKADLRKLLVRMREGIYHVMDHEGFKSEDGLKVGSVRYLDETDFRRLIEVLKETEDLLENFPHGKWVTIQHLQGWLG